jgi:hypothetical protein
MTEPEENARGDLDPRDAATAAGAEGAVLAAGVLEHEASGLVAEESGVERGGPAVVEDDRVVVAATDGGRERGDRLAQADTAPAVEELDEGYRVHRSRPK